MADYPRMLYHPDGRKRVVRDEQHHAEVGREGFCALDKAGKMIGSIEDEKDPVDEIVNAFKRTDPPISEAVRDLAEHHGIDWRRMNGTGKDGRILKSDIRKHVDDHQNG